jgi:hypothetical protein
MHSKSLYYIKIFATLLFITSGFNLSAQSDSTTGDNLKFDLGIIRDKNRHLWPLIYKHKNNEYKDLQLLFTIYRNYRTYENPSKHNHLLPFYWYNNNEIVKDVRIGTLYYPTLFRFINDTINKSKSFRFLELAPEINLLNITKSKTGLFTQNNFFFFIWSKNDVLKNKSNFILFPFYWYYRNNYRQTSTLLPLFRQVKIKDKDEKKLAFYPALYFYKKENNFSRHSLAMLFYDKKETDSNSVEVGRKTVLFPIYFSKYSCGFRFDFFNLKYVVL